MISGKVQGVFYRARAKEIALGLKICGWIRNTTDGKVEAKITGDEDKLSAFISWCGVGPREAIVTEVVVSDVQVESFSGFQIAK